MQGVSPGIKVLGWAGRLEKNVFGWRTPVPCKNNFWEDKRFFFYPRYLARF